MRILFAFIILLTLFGCSSTIHTYGVKEANSAVLAGPYHVDLTAINEKFPANRPGCTGPVCTKGFKIYFSEGAHSIDVALATGNAYTGTVRLAFYARSGKQYQFKHSEKDGVVINEKGTWQPVIVDVSTNKVVSHYKDVQIP
ncbi:hypothetical protein CWB73_16365 [Pseudoalteromonas phenolica]|uniref:Lipoprotein n=1 Tax=Pseudoalteromonas phenolica TaxID=161398 RepID=A0A5S3YRG4_9GAMM|nr:hypothetical protein [Pseudoalteromonas phenolica]TMP78627.1 hypothetical protein CWB73_16365 [Pseudoalteromonas phenolica]